MTPAVRAHVIGAAIIRNYAPSPRAGPPRRVGLVYRWVFLACVVALSGCNLGPRYHRPDIPPPAAWRPDEAAADAAWPSSEGGQGFGSAPVNRLIEDAQHSNDDIAAAIARVREADAQARIAGAPLLPAISATGDATRETVLNLTNTGRVTTNEFSALLNAPYDLDFWGKNRAALYAAR